jgi:hypothetical protein
MIKWVGLTYKHGKSQKYDQNEKLTSIENVLSHLPKNDSSNWKW